MCAGYPNGSRNCAPKVPKNLTALAKSQRSSRARIVILALEHYLKIASAAPVLYGPSTVAPQPAPEAKS
jgi:hypothetical protein